MKRKGICVLALATVLSMEIGNVLPALAAPLGGVHAVKSELEHPVLTLEFENNLNDESGEGNTPQISGNQYEYVEGADSGKALSLKGNTYVNLGKNIHLQPENMTLSFWIKPNAVMTGEQLISWNKAEYYTDGWYLSSENDKVPLALSVGPAKENGQPYKVSVSGERKDFFPTGEWTHVAVTYNKETKEVAIYRNGIPQETIINYPAAGESTGILGSDATMEKSIGYNGPVYRGSYLNAALDSYRLYNDTATAEEVMALYEEQGGAVDKSAIARKDLEALVIPSETTRNIALPVKGEQGSDISWSVEEGTAMNEKGEVTRPEEGQPDAKVKLKASASFMGGPKEEKMFEITVLAKTKKDLANTSIMDDVTLEDDYLANAFEKEEDYLLSLSAEKFLYEFYKVAGLEPTTEEGYGGWERSDGTNFRGHAFGHYMSALSQAYLSETDEAVKAELMKEITAAVDGVKKCQDAYAAAHPESAGYVSAFRESILDQIDGTGTSDENVIVPWYNLHKVLAGLIDIGKNVDDQQVKETAIETAEAFGEYVYHRCSKLSDKTIMLRTEYGGMNEALYELYRITGNDHIKAAAEYFDETALFEKLAANQDVLSGLHANTTIPKLTGALKRYTVLTENEEYYNKLTQEEKEGLGMYLEAAENFWDIVVEHHTYVTGGNSQSEHFHDADKLAYDATKGSYDGALTCETCNTYNMLKLSKALFDVTKDPKYIDYFERTFTNAILASQNPETGTTMYFQPMGAGYNKVYNHPYDEFWCCTGTGMENFSKLGDYIYNIDGDYLYVNMFYSSSVTDEAHGIQLIQKSDIPNQDTATFRVNALAGGVNKDVKLALRKPDWLAGKAVIKVNGKQQELKEENGFYLVEHVKDGDEISYQLPMKVTVETAADDSNFAALKYGPVVLAAELGNEDIDSSQPNGILVRVATEDTDAKDTITVQNMSVEEWKADVENQVVRIENSADGKIQFALKNTDSDELIFSPYYEQHDQRYGIYMHLEEPDSQASQDRILEEKEKLREQEVSVDYLDSFDNNNSEFAKNLQSKNSSVGTFNGRTYRHAENGGWFSYDLKVDQTAEHNYLNCTYYSGDVGRTFDLYINDEKLKTVIITKNAGNNVFYTETDEIPQKYIENAKKDSNGNPVVTVRFQSTGGFAGGLFGISIKTSEGYDTDARLAGLTFDKGVLEPEFAPDTKEYTLKVSKDAETVNMLASTMKKSGLVYIGDILFNNDKERTITLEGETTEVSLLVKAQDHQTSDNYKITIVKTDEIPDNPDNPDPEEPDSGQGGDEIPETPGLDNGNGDGSQQGQRQPSNQNKTVKTGDTSNVPLAIGGAAAAIVVVGAVLFIRRKRK